MQEELKILKEKADLVQSDIYKKIRNYQIEKIITLTSTDPLEVRGMMKLIKHTDSWLEEYNNNNNNKG